MKDSITVQTVVNAPMERVSIIYLYVTNNGKN